MKFSDSVVYLDNHLLVVNKPPLLATQSSPAHSMSLEVLARAWIKTQFAKSGEVFLHPIHRLDRVASGLVCFARTSKALSRLQEQMRKARIDKWYVAQVEGKTALRGLYVDSLEKREYKAAIVKRGKRAELRFRLLRYQQGMSAVLIQLRTGRYHQIRAQFSHRNHPIIGDRKYGASTPFKGIALHHWKMRLVHPTKKTRHTFKAPLKEVGYAWM